MFKSTYELAFRDLIFYFNLSVTHKYKIRQIICNRFIHKHPNKKIYLAIDISKLEL